MLYLYDETHPLHESLYKEGDTTDAGIQSVLNLVPGKACGKTNTVKTDISERLYVLGGAKTDAYRTNK